MRRLLLITLLLSSLGFGADIYVSQSGAGGATGANCANAIALATFNASGTGGNNYHLCGTLTAALNTTVITVPDNNITLTWESGASVESPQAGANGIIFINGKSGVTLDGGTAVSGTCGTSTGVCNGVVQNTASGTLLANQPPSGSPTFGASLGIDAIDSPNLEIKNLLVANVYQNTCFAPCVYPTNWTDIAGASTAGIKVSGNSGGLKVHNNTVHGAKTDISINFGAVVVDSQQIYSNYVYDAVWGIVHSNSTGGSIATNVGIYSNEVGDMGYPNWEGPNSNYHVDGIMVWTCLGCPEYKPLVYSNYLHGIAGRQGNAWIFSTLGGGTAGVPSGNHAIIFNNLIVDGGPGPGYTNAPRPIFISGGTGGVGQNTVVNNTVVQTIKDSSSSLGVCYDTPTCGDVWKNNIVLSNSHAMNIGQVASSTFASTSAVAGNVYWDIGTGVAYTQFINGSQFLSFAQWQALGYDPSPAAFSNPNLDANYLIQNTLSPAYLAGSNLTSLGIPQLNVDRSGNFRPTVGNWDAGANQLVSAPPPPPFTLTASCAGGGTGAGPSLTGGTGISCTCTAGVASGTCSESHAAGDNVTLTEHPGSAIFKSWNGSGTGSGTTRTITNIQDNANVIAQFDVAVSSTLTSKSLACAGEPVTFTFTCTNGTSASFFDTLGDQFYPVVGGPTFPTTGTALNGTFRTTVQPTSYTYSCFVPGGQSSSTTVAMKVSCYSQGPLSGASQ